MVAVLRAAAKALPLQAQHCDGARAVGSHQDLSLRFTPPARADDPAADAAARRERGLGEDAFRLCAKSMSSISLFKAQEQLTAGALERRPPE